MIRKIILKPKSSFSELFTSDQLWGQMIWGISDIYGKSEASAAVKNFIENPPFLISSLMIDGYLPKPLYVDVLGDLDSDVLKHNKKCRWLPYDTFKQLQQDCLYLSEHKIGEDIEAFHSVDEIHISINRDTFKAIDGGLFNSTYLWTDKTLCFYLKYSDLSAEWEEILNAVFKYWEKVGLGGDKNVGHGQFDISYVDISDIEKEIFDFKDSEFFISLSDCSGTDLSPVSYSLDVYSGITGRANDGLYRKNPIIRYRTGSLFLNGKGSLIENKECASVYSYGLAFPIFMRYEGD